MLFTDQSDGHDAASRQRDRHPEEALEHENAFGVMPERPVAEVRYDRLRFVEPLMERERVVRRPAPAARRGKRMVIKIGRASCRERVCQDVKISVVAVSVKNK